MKNQTSQRPADIKGAGCSSWLNLAVNLADCDQLNIHLFPFQVCRRTYCGCETVKKNMKNPLKSQCLVCPIWATIETWQAP